MAIFISFLTIANIFVEITAAECFVKEKRLISDDVFFSLTDNLD